MAKTKWGMQFLNPMCTLWQGLLALGLAACQILPPHPGTLPSSSAGASQSPLPMASPTAVGASPVPSASPLTAPEQGLVAHYAFEGNLKSQDGLHDGKARYDPESQQDVFFYKPQGITGQAASFGAGLIVTPEAYVFGKPGFDFKSSFTFSVWVYLSENQSLTASWAILASTDIDPMSYAFYWTPGGAEVILNKGTPDALWIRRVDHPRPEVQQPHVWQHWAATYDGQAVKIYFNGKLDLQTPYSKPLLQTADSADLYIGRCDGLRKENTNLSFSGYLTSFQGTMDELRLYNRALNPEEIERLYKLKQ